MQMEVHGGDIYRNEIEYDFSVNVNPLGVPEAVKHAMQEAISVCDCYPDIHARALTDQLRIVEHADNCEILCGNGASELFMAVVHALRPKKVLIPVPSFYGYEWAAQAVDSEIVFYGMKKEMGFCLDKGIFQYLTEDIDLLFLANPNNPVGNVITDSLLLEILEKCRALGIWVVLDECFLDFTGKAGFGADPDNWKRYPDVIVVKAFTKLYAVPGVRLGYLLTGNRTLAQRVRRQLPEWNLSVFAQYAGLAALEETEYRRKTVEYVKTERIYLEKELKRLGIYVYPGEADYLLLYSEIPLYGKLLDRKLLIRDCSNYRGLGSGFYRVAVKTHAENEILIRAINDLTYCKK